MATIEQGLGLSLYLISGPILDRIQTKHGPQLWSRPLDQAVVPRSRMLFFIEFLVTVPLIITWILVFVSLIRHPAVRHHASRHPAVPALALVGASIGALFSYVFSPSLHTGTFLAYVGFALGWYLATFCLTGRWKFTLNDGHGAQATESNPGAQHATSSAKTHSSTESSLVDTYDAHHIAILLNALMIWLSASICTIVSESIMAYTSIPLGEKPSFIRLVATNRGVWGLVPWVAVAHYYIKKLTSVAWESACAVASAAVCLTLLRQSSDNCTWEGRLMDGGLSFLVMNIGLGLGTFTKNTAFARHFRELSARKTTDSCRRS